MLRRDWPKCLTLQDIDMKLEYVMFAVRAICRKYVPEDTSKTDRNKIPREKKIFLRRRKKVANRLNQHTNSSEIFRLKAKLIGIKKCLQETYVKGSAEKELGL